MRPHLVVVAPPGLDLLPRVGQIEEPVLVQTLVAELAVEALDETVLHGPSGGDEVQLHLILVSPLIHHLTGKLGPVVDHDRLRLAASSLQFFQHPHAPLTRLRGVHLDAWRVAREAVHQVQSSELAPTGECILGEVHGPDLVGAHR